MVDYVKVRKEGGSRVVTLPPRIVAALRLAVGDQLALLVADGQLVATRVEPGKDARRFLPRRAKG